LLFSEVFVDRITRKKLKQDEFAEDVGLTVDFLNEHRPQAIKYGAAGLIAIVLIVGLFAWFRYRGAERQAALSEALQVWQTPVGPAQEGLDIKPFATDQDKQKAVQKAFSEVAAKYSGSNEAAVAEYYMGATAANDGKLAAAEMAFKEVIDSGNANYASLAKMILAGVYQSEHRQADGEKLLQSLVDKPTDFVSKEQATIALARYIASSDPERAKKLLTPLRTARPAISRLATAELNALPAK
jgi:predicted negative regulator of RcsB-dependent stress response